MTDLLDASDLPYTGPGTQLKETLWIGLSIKI